MELTPSQRGIPPLHQLDPKGVEAWLSAGGDPNCEDATGVTPLAHLLQVAVTQQDTGCREALNLLLLSGADPDRRTLLAREKDRVICGLSPFERAAQLAEQFEHMKPYFEVLAGYRARGDISPICWYNEQQPLFRLPNELFVQISRRLDPASYFTFSAICSSITERLYPSGYRRMTLTNQLAERAIQSYNMFATSELRHLAMPQGHHVHISLLIDGKPETLRGRVTRANRLGIPLAPALTSATYLGARWVKELIELIDPAQREEAAEAALYEVCNWPVAFDLSQQQALEFYGDRRRADDLGKRVPIFQTGEEVPAIAVMRVLSRYINARKERNQPYLHLVAGQGSALRTRYLIEEMGANIHATGRSNGTALHAACRGLSLEMVALLLRMGGDPNSRDDEGSTPLHYACQGIGPHSASIMRLLVANGADVNARNHYEGTPLEQLLNDIQEHALFDIGDPLAAEEHRGLTNRACFHLLLGLGAHPKEGLIIAENYPRAVRDFYDDDEWNAISEPERTELMRQSHYYVNALRELIAGEPPLKREELDARHSQD